MVIAFLQTKQILPNLQAPALVRTLRVPETHFFQPPKRKHRTGTKNTILTPAIERDTTFVEGLHEHPVVWVGQADLAPTTLRDLFEAFLGWLVDGDGGPHGQFSGTRETNIRRGGVVQRTSVSLQRREPQERAERNLTDASTSFHSPQPGRQALSSSSSTPSYLTATTPGMCQGRLPTGPFARRGKLFLLCNAMRDWTRSARLWRAHPCRAGPIPRDHFRALRGARLQSCRRTW